MAHFDKVMLQNLARRHPLGGVELQHGLEHVHEHQPICVFHNFVRNIVVAEVSGLKEEKCQQWLYRPRWIDGWIDDIKIYMCVYIYL